jgi:ring-1,2-phenylacetyl-CoA epoxidase subunit PaaD
VVTGGGRETAAPRAVEDIWRALAEVEDPELPIGIIDMGLVQAVTRERAAVRIELLPTFTGCPALEVIRDRVRRRVLALAGVEAVDVVFVFEPAWTIERMSETGRARLREHGMSVPLARLAEPVACPHCGSTNMVLENPFGPTLCRAIYYCRNCRNPVERFKPPADELPARHR